MVPLCVCVCVLSTGHKGHHHDHMHDSAVSSVSIVSEGTLDLDEVINFHAMFYPVAPLTQLISLIISWLVFNAFPLPAVI